MKRTLLPTLLLFCSSFAIKGQSNTAIPDIEITTTYEYSYTEDGNVAKRTIKSHSQLPESTATPNPAITITVSPLIATTKITAIIDTDIDLGIFSYQYRILNINTAMVHRQGYIQDMRTTIDVSSLASGYYLIVIFNNNIQIGAGAFGKQ